MCVSAPVCPGGELEVDRGYRFEEREMKVTVTSAIVTTILIANAQAWAHHSHANYVESEWLSLEGTVR